MCAVGCGAIGLTLREGPRCDTALHAAAAMGQTRAASELLAHGADLTLRDSEWGNPLAATARYFGHAELAALLDGHADRGEG